MRLRTGGTRAEIPAAPAAVLALLLLLLVGIAVAFNTDRGILVRISGKGSGATLPPPDDAVFLALMADASLLLDGEPVALERLLERLASRIGRNGSRPVVLRVSDDVPYGAMVTLVDLLSGGDASSGFRVRRLLLPTHVELTQWVRTLGRDPFRSDRTSESEVEP